MLIYRARANTSARQRHFTFPVKRLGRVCALFELMTGLICPVVLLRYITRRWMQQRRQVLNKMCSAIAEHVGTIPHLALIEKKRRMFKYKETFERTNGTVQYFSPASKKLKSGKKLTS